MEKESEKHAKGQSMLRQHRDGARTQSPKTRKTSKSDELRNKFDATAPPVPVPVYSEVKIKEESIEPPSLLQFVQDQEIDKKKEVDIDNLKGKKEKKRKKRKGSFEPHKPCPICGGNHWKKDCDQRLAKRIKKEIEPNELDCETETRDQKTKQAYNSDPFLDGTFVVVKIPMQIVDTFTEDIFANLCEKAGVIRPETIISQLSRCFWLIRYTTKTMAEEVVGKNIIFPTNLGLPREMMTEILNYIPGGPRVFWTDRSIPFTEIEIQEMIEQKFPARAYWMGTKMVGMGTKTDKMLVHFKRSIAVCSFELAAGKNFVQFRVAARSKECFFCKKEHSEGITLCPKVWPSAYGPSLKYRLTRRPQP